MCVGVWMCVQNKGVLILTGATLKGPFSRYDYQRAPNSGPSSVKSYKTLLPAAARDVYYRDEIGNISTSHLREDEDFIELELTPRPAVYQKDLLAFQCDVNLISQWTLQNHLSLNCNKTKYMFIPVANFPIYVNNNQLEIVHGYKYLGVWISDDLTWTERIDSIYM